MNVIERERIILKQLETTDYLTVEQIADLTGASLPTVRRDIKRLEEQPEFVRFRGGIALASMESNNKRHFVAKMCEEDPGYSTINQLEINHNEKVRIAKKAAEYVDDGDTIYMDGSTTVYYMIEFLKNKDIMVVTNGLDIINKLMEYQIATYVLNGQVNPKARNILGIETAEQLSKVNFDKVFIGTRGVDEACGMTTTDTFDAMLKKEAISKARETYVLTDSSKFFQKKLYSYANLDEVVIITDDTNGFQSTSAKIVLCD